MPYDVGTSAGHGGAYTGPNETTVQYNYKGGALGAHGAAVTGSGGDALPRPY
jgi:hypothetical protein